MSDELRELYQEVILDHGRNPRNRKKMESPDNCAKGHNPLCGDEITIYLRMRDGLIEEVGFDGAGCAISMASASMMSQALKGRSLEEGRKLFQAFQDLVTGEGGEDDPELGKLVVFGGVREFPMRVKCATLAWHTLRAALEGQDDSVTTD